MTNCKLKKNAGEKNQKDKELFSPTNTTHSKIRRPYCRECGSENIQFDAFAEWDEKSQSFVVLSTMDDGHCCEDCGCETTVKWTSC